MDYNGMYGMQAGPFGFRPSAQQNPYQQMMSPYQQNMASQASMRPPENNVLQVNGRGGVDSYQLPPRSSVVLFDSNNDLFYMKTTDDGGYATVRTFAFSEVTGQSQGPTAEYVTRQEFTDALNKIQEAIVNGQQPIQQPATAASIVPAAKPAATAADDAAAASGGN